MLKVHFKKDNIAVEVPEGKPLIEICNENKISEPYFLCKDGTCGTCLCPIDKPENLAPNPPDEKETERLKIFFAKPNERLACQVKVKGDIMVG